MSNRLLVSVWRVGVALLIVAASVRPVAAGMLGDVTEAEIRTAKPGAIIRL